jgi:hypothetical protein
MPNHFPSVNLIDLDSVASVASSVELQGSLEAEVPLILS